MNDHDQPENAGFNIPDPEAVENRYWTQTLGTTSLSARGNRSFWD